MADAILVIKRSDEVRKDRVRAYRIMLDDNELGRIKAGSTEKFVIQTGNHSLRLKIDWTGSPDVSFEIGESETIEFECEPNKNRWGALADLIMSARPDSQSWIRLVLSRKS